jgi:hypothetical protein
VQLISQALERFKLPFTSESWKYFAGSGKFILLLDAFDEVDPALTQRTLSDIEHMAALYRKNLQIIITSRPDSDIQKSSHFRIFKLSPLTSSDHAPFLKKICTDKDQADSLEKVIKASSSDVAGLLTTPLMMTLLVILYKSLQTVPDTVPRFYEELFDVLFYRHDHSKPGFRRKRFTQLDDQSVKHVFSAFCFFYRLQGLGILTTADFLSCCEQACAATSIDVDFRLLKNELIRTICLIQEESFEISFIHKSVAQYYAASFISKSGDDFSKQFYDLAATSNHWALELRFLSQIDAFRFNKFYELPLLRKAAKEFDVSFKNPDPIEELKIAAFLSGRASIVFDREVKKLGKGNLLGWSSGRNGLESHHPWVEFSFDFVGPIFTALERVKFTLPDNMMNSGNNPTFVLISKLEEFANINTRDAARRVLLQLRRRYEAANKIINTEGVKAEMLAAFIKKVG